MRFIFVIFCIQLIFTQSSQSPYYNADGNKYNISNSKLAVQGYDLVEYFKSNKAVRGSADFETIHENIKYRFINKENMTKFIQSPSSFLPQYGGYCAYGVGFTAKEGGSKPGKYPINPKSFKIVDGKLYLFYHTDSYSALAKWNQNEKVFLDNAEKRWYEMHPEIEKEKEKEKV